MSKTALALSEQAFMAVILELAAWGQWRCYHTHDSRRSPAGFPDLVMVRPPELLVVELKSDRGRLTPAQNAWLEALGQCPGVETYVWRPQDWLDIAQRLQRPPLLEGRSGSYELAATPRD